MVHVWHKELVVVSQSQTTDLTVLKDFRCVMTFVSN